ncbi:hypothetical protein DFH27DRAFT_598807 [Peziza echinospora]|nr:hypothetical protein DFH27DRAFT_598807 [Peziza echinospora]
MTADEPYRAWLLRTARRIVRPHVIRHLPGTFSPSAHPFRLARELKPAATCSPGHQSSRSLPKAPIAHKSIKAISQPSNSPAQAHYKPTHHPDPRLSTIHTASIAATAANQSSTFHNYLWKFYLENDAESFRRLLLEGNLPSGGKPKRANIGDAGAASRAPNSAAENGQIINENKSNISRPKATQGSKSQNLRVSFNRQTLKEYDSNGRSLMHLASTEPRYLSFLQALLKHPQTDLLHPDLESGWTPLHRALYHGNISAARLLFSTATVLAGPSGGPVGNLIVKSKDRSGETPFELFDSTIEGLEQLLDTASPRKTNVDSDDEDDGESFSFKQAEQRHGKRADKQDLSGRDEVFSFGSNKNLTLGFADGDDRQHPERLTIQRPHALLAELHDKDSFDDLTAIQQFKPLGIEDVQLSKLHSAIITKDPYSNLYICGFGHGGRLGFGDQQATQFTYRNVTIGDEMYKVRQVALGLDHTVAVLHNGEVWTWGGNKYGQLGYSTKSTSGNGTPTMPSGKGKKAPNGGLSTEEADAIQTTPRQVISNIKREAFIGCAASRIHTVIYTTDSLFMFGKNEGQLGILDSSDAKTLATQPSPRKVAAGFLADHKILMATATDRSTAVMLDNHTVWVFTNYSYAQIKFPVQRLTGNLRRAAGPSNDFNLITKIISGGETICALTGTGDVFAVEIPRPSGEGGRIQVPIPSKVWGRRNRLMAAKDVDVGQDGSIILCTESGAVWRRINRIKGSENPGPPSNNTIASTSGILPGLHEARIRDHKFSRVAGLTRIASVRSNKFGAFAAIRRDCNIMQTQLHLKPSTFQEDIVSLLCFRSIFNTSTIGKQNTRILDTAPENWIDPPKSKAKLLSIIESLDLEDYDMVLSISPSISNLQVPAHRGILLAKSLELRERYGELKSKGPSGAIEWEDGRYKLQYTQGRLQLIFSSEKDIMIPLLFLLDMYTHHCLLLNYTRLSDATFDSYRRIWQAFRIEVSPPISHHALDGLNLHFFSALQDPIYTASGDLIARLADGEKMWLHSCIMRTRCPFFETLYKGGAQGLWIKSRKERAKKQKSYFIEVDMRHIPLAVFKVVVDYIYTDREDLFDDMRGMETLEEFLYFVLDVLAVANELMLDRLSTICQKLLGNYVNTRNASQLLQAVDAYSQTGFRDMCLKYMSFNMEAMLENHLLDDLDTSIMDELDQSVRRLQIQCSPESRSDKRLKSLARKYPSIYADSARERENAILSYSTQKTSTLTAVGLETASSTSTKPKLFGAEGPAAAGLPSTEGATKTKFRNELTYNTTSNVSKPVQGRGNELMFNMDDENEQSSNGKQPESESIPQQGPSRSKKNVRIEFPWQDDNAGRLPENSPLGDSKPQLAQHSPSSPWEKPANVSALDLKEIMARAGSSSTRKSNLAAEASTPASPATVVTRGFTPIPKISQKEKRRLQQNQQHIPTSSTTPITPEKKQAPWNTPLKAPRIVLKDIFGASESKAPVSGGSATVSRPNPTRPRNPTLHLHSNPSLPSPSVATAGPSISTPPGSKPPQPRQNPPAFSPSGNPQVNSPSTPKAPPPSFALPPRASPIPQKRPTPPIRSAILTPTNDFPALPNPRAQNSSNPFQSSPDLGLNLSLADIISQQEAEQDFIKGRLEKKALADIQAEQEFMDWWEKESERIRNLENGGAAAVEGNVNSVGGGRGGRGGRSGKGKGKGRDGASGGGGSQKADVGEGSSAPGRGRGGGGGPGGGGRGGGVGNNRRGGDRSKKGGAGKEGDGAAKAEPIRGIVIK